MKRRIQSRNGLVTSMPAAWGTTVIVPSEVQSPFSPWPTCRGSEAELIDLAVPIGVGGNGR